jgi:hypothetical protein
MIIVIFAVAKIGYKINPSAIRGIAHHPFQKMALLFRTDQHQLRLQSESR